MIKCLELNGYRSLRHAIWKPGKLNLVVGPNGSGKSTLLQVLALISKAAKGEFAKRVTKAGGMIPLLWDHQPGSFGWKLLLDASDEKRPDRNATYDVVVEQIGKGSAYRFQHDSLVFWNEPSLPFGEGENAGIRRESNGQVLKRAFLNGVIQNIEVKSFDENESLIADVQKWEQVISIQRWALYQDIVVGPDSSMRRPTSTQYVTQLDDSASNLAPVLHTLYTGNRDFKDAIDEGMRAGFGNEYDQLVFQPAAAQQIQLAVHWKSSREPHAGYDLSDGTLRFLFLLTALAQPDPPKLIALEEPEIGLHPSMLAIVADFAEAVSERTQVIITSHSPDFLDAFTDKEPSVTLCNWSEGMTSLYALDSDRLGAWLDKYRLGEMFTSGELDALALPDVAESGTTSESVTSEPYESSTDLIDDEVVDPTEESNA